MHNRITTVLFVVCLFSLANCVSMDSGDAPDPLTWKNMEKYLMYASSAFCISGLKNWTCYWCTLLPDLPHINVTLVVEGDSVYGIYGFVGYNENTIVASFRGTSSWQNILSDLEFWLSAYPEAPNAKVHHGFYSAWLTVQTSVIKAVQMIQQQTNITRVVATGHSLGAAISEFCAVDLARNGIKGVEIWNFGQPRTGNSDFSNFVTKLVSPIWRVVNQADIVPHYPFQDVGYHHEPTEVWFPSNATVYKVCSSNNGEDKSCSDSLEPWDYRPNDHIHYLGFDQTAGKTHGCHSEYK